MTSLFQVLKTWVRADWTHVPDYLELSSVAKGTPESQRAYLHNMFFKFMVFKSDCRSLACFIAWKK